MTIHDKKKDGDKKEEKQNNKSYSGCLAIIIFITPQKMMHLNFLLLYIEIQSYITIQF